MGMTNDEHAIDRAVVEEHLARIVQRGQAAILGLVCEKLTTADALKQLGAIVNDAEACLERMGVIPF
jgi:BarA-like signal transduction histidine kinase